MGSPSSREDIYQHLQRMLVEEFEIDASAISPEALLYEDLGIDSIDAVDMIVQLQNITGERIPPERFRSVRTVQDVVDTVHALAA
ncbi:acyl carrier protein [Marinihelvus fidelis]|uniref:Acyl carrier protein n=1 Tax=Marinihelvus fidelis TaxID=2613842 RepID=A0A5N0T8X7_9GAMM|nr:acyl carrier protein [Marinihelvus fidelis]KAA9131400.1 acyl carrier protein [Marinihelvus fidelis]